MDRKFGLIGLVSQEFLPGLSSRGKAPNEKLGQKGLQLSFQVYDPETSLRDREDKRLPLNFCPCVGSFAALDEVSHYSTYLAAHPGVRAPGCCQVPHGG